MAKKWKQSIIKKITTTDYLPTNSRQLMLKMLPVMEKHIGEENKTTMEGLFEKLFGTSSDNVSDLQYFMLSSMVSSVISRLRGESNCFIVRNGSFLWVAKTQDDYKLYRRHTNERIKGLEFFAERCKKSVSQEWYKQPFQITKKPNAKQIGVMTALFGGKL